MAPAAFISSKNIFRGVMDDVRPCLHAVFLRQSRQLCFNVHGFLTLANAQKIQANEELTFSPSIRIFHVVTWRSLTAGGARASPSHTPWTLISKPQILNPTWRHWRAPTLTRPSPQRCYSTRTRTGSTHSCYPSTSRRKLLNCSKYLLVWI